RGRRTSVRFAQRRARRNRRRLGRHDRQAWPDFRSVHHRRKHAAGPYELTTMLNAKGVFYRNIRQAIELGVLYDHLSNTVAIPEQFDDLLRSQIVNAVSAFDKLMHDLIRI